MYWLFNLILILMFAAVSAILIVMPFLTRKTISFGISVSEEMYYSKTVAGMRRTYAWVTGSIHLALTAAFAVAMFTSQEETISRVIIPVYAALMVISSVFTQILFYFRMKRYKASQPVLPKSQERLVLDTSFRQNKLVYSDKWFLLHLVIIAVNLIFALTNYDLAPKVIPMQYSWNGDVTRSVDKSFTSVLFPNIMQVFMLGLFFMINRIIYKSKQQLDPGKAPASVQQNVLFRRRWSLFNLASSFLLILLFSFMQLTMFHQINTSTQFTVALMVPVFIVISALLLSVQTGQGGSRLGQAQAISKTMPVNDDEYWKLGNVYYNPKDPSLFVEKRMGVGWTINMGRPLAWLIFLAPFVIIILVTTFLAP